MGLKKCPECGELVSDELTECKNCGYPFDGTEEKIEESKMADDISETNMVNEEKYENTIENSTEEEETVQESVPTQNPIEDDESDKENNVESDVNSGAAQSEKKEIKKSSGTKRKVAYVGVGIIVLCLLVNNIHYVSKYKEYRSKYNKLQNQYNDLRADFDIQKQELKKAGNQNDELSDQISTLTAENDELKNGAKKQLNDVKNSYEKGDWNKTIELANTLHSKYNGSDEDKEAQKLAAESQKKIDEANAAKEAEKAKGYETGITYDQLARTPGDYEGKKVKFSGRVVQVIEGDDSINIRLAVNDNYDTVLLGEYSKSIVSSRVLEDDNITIYGTSVGTISYQSTMGGTITIPGVYIEKIDQ